MRFLTFSIDQNESWGAVIDTESGHGIVDLGARFGGSLHRAINNQQLQHFKDKVSGLSSDIATSEVQFLPPIVRPGKIACIGVNYANRNAEYKDGSEPPKYPSLFMRTPGSLTGHLQPLIRPPESHQLDYEGEIVIVIGKAGRRITEENAYKHIAGLTIMNEGTLRDWVCHAKFNVTQGKNFVHSGAIGPWMVTADEFSGAQYESMRLTTRVNGEERQNDTTSNMMFPFKYIVSYLSIFYHLEPGDVIATGTPNGAGARFDPPQYLAPGDIVEVAVTGIGKLVNDIKDEVL